MCGRFTLRASAKDISDLFAVDVQLELLPRYNVAPTQDVLAIRAAEEPSGAIQRKAVKLRWGLIPSWANDPSIGASLINARAETVATKPAFRSAFKKQRCLVVADGFYEWKKLAKGKQPFYITRADGKPFAFAGLYEHWRHGELKIDSCTIITTNANETVRELHNRMPVILSEMDFSKWLDPRQAEATRLQQFLKPLPEDELILNPVSTLVNKPSYDQPDCIESITAEPAPTEPSRERNRTLFD
jgi:putative SOS response-associated peptidase YedK